MPHTPVRQWPFVMAGVGVCAAAMAVGGWFGALGTFLYDEAGEAVSGGTLLGGAGGLLAGVLWSWRLTVCSARRIPNGRGAGPVLCGVLWGLAAGALATVLLHVELMALLGAWQLLSISVGLLFGVPAGAALGLICGLSWWALESLEWRRAKALLAQDTGGAPAP